jgi:hypothetical protein
MPEIFSSQGINQFHFDLLFLLRYREVLRKRSVHQEEFILAKRANFRHFRHFRHSRHSKYSQKSKSLLGRLVTKPDVFPVFAFMEYFELETGSQNLEQEPIS